MSNDQIRLAVLELLHNDAQQEPYSIGTEKKKVQDTLAISDKQTDFAILYLKQKGLVHLESVMGGNWWAKITAYGIDVVEHKGMYANQLPFVNVTIQQVQGNNYGAMAQILDSTVSNFEQQVTDALTEANSQIENKPDLSPEAKKEIADHLKELEGELKKGKKDAGAIQKASDWLHANAAWLYPTITSIIIEGVKIALHAP